MNDDRARQRRPDREMPTWGVAVAGIALAALLAALMLWALHFMDSPVVPSPARR